MSKQNCVGLDEIVGELDGLIELEGVADFVGKLVFVGEVERVADFVGKVDGEIVGEVEGVADFVGELEGLRELVGGRETLPPSQIQQCSVADPISPAQTSAEGQ